MVMTLSQIACLLLLLLLQLLALALAWDACWALVQLNVTVMLMTTLCVAVMDKPTPAGASPPCSLLYGLVHRSSIPATCLHMIDCPTCAAASPTNEAHLANDLPLGVQIAHHHAQSHHLQRANMARITQDIAT
jgi:hypothetical protein